LAVFGCLLVSASVAAAQIDRGTIKGSVFDASGAVVPNTKIEIIRTDTNSTINIATDNQGLYNVPNLPAGTYRVMATKQGFKTGVSEAVDVRPTVQVQVDFHLDPGELSETVQVTGEAPILDVSTTNNATGLKAEELHELPYILSGTKRSVTAFLQNLPGFNNSNATFLPRANGAQVGNTEVFLDGGRASEQISRGAFEENGPMIEQIGSFNVVQNSFNAEYGGFGSWFTTATIKSGSNSVRGSIFNHFSNSALNARNYFAASKTSLNQHEGGFTLGGPLVIPHIYNGRDKTFFFGSLGLFFSRQGASGNLTTVPLPEFVGKGTAMPGDFDFRKLGVNIYDPATSRSDASGTITRDQVTCKGVANVICGDRVSPVTQKLLQYIPRPDDSSLLTNNFHANNAATWPWFNTYVPLVKVDHNISNAQKLSVMYTNQVRHRELWTGGLVPTAEWGAVQTNPLDYQTDQIANSWKARINHDFIISNSVLNHVTFSADRYINLEPNKTNGQGWDQNLGITGIPADNGVFPFISFSGGTALSPNYGRAFTQDWREMNYNFNENLTWNRGKHTIKFGGELGTTGINQFAQSGLGGSFAFSSFTTSSGTALSGGNSFASFLLGAANTVSARIPVQTGLRWRRYAVFAQDEWRMTPKLTMSYGLRWDYQPPYFDANNRLSSFDPNLSNPGAGGLKGALAFAGGTYGRSFQEAWKKGFGPRLGVAYQITDKMLVRASSGIYYATTANGTQVNAPGWSSTPTFTSPNNYDPIMNWAAESFPQNFARPPVQDPSFSNGQAILYIPPNGGRLPQIVSWTVSVQRELARNFSAEVTYLGNHSTHLAMPAAASSINVVPIEDLSLGSVLLQPITSAAAVNAGFKEPFPGFRNQLGANTVAQSLKPFPQYTSVDMNSALLPEGEAKYNSLQLKGTKRFAGGFSFLAFVTWSKQTTNSAVTQHVQYPLFHASTIDPAVVPLVFSSSGTYELPFGAGKPFFNTSSPLARLISGWRVSGFVRYTSGAPLLITANNNLGPLGYPAKLADRVADQSATLVTDPGEFVGGPSGSRYLNAAAFAAPAAFALGNSGGYLSDVRGFVQKQEAISVGKWTKLTDHTTFELTADFTNPFNFHRWNDPATNTSAATFGTVTSAQAPRQIQINASITF
jgi:hypothetical protein